MQYHISRYWWLFLFRGIAAILLSILALWIPSITFNVLILLLGAYMFFDGIFSVITFMNKRNNNRYKNWLVATGIMGIIIGIFTFINPLATGMAMVYLVAFWAMIAGIAEISIGIWLHKEIKGEGWYIAAGILSILFSIFLLADPIRGAVTLTVIFGIYALIAGVFLLSLSARLRRKHLHNNQAAPPVYA